MNREIVLRPEAEADIVDAFRWYEEQVPGLGQEFLNELEKQLAWISANPEANAPVHRNLRRALLRRFPFGVFFATEKGRIVIVAVFHSARNPGSWIGRDGG